MLTIHIYSFFICKMCKLASVVKKNKSVTNRIKRTDQRIDPWGTPDKWI